MSGEAYVPGPCGPHRHVADLVVRFHNVRGLVDDQFRSYYLSQARHACDILVLAETGCRTEKEESMWARDWRGSGGVFWASGPRRAQGDRGHSGRGMAVMVSSSAAVQKCRVVGADEGGRFIALAMEVSGCPVVIVGCHAEKGIGEPKDGDVDAQQEAFFRRVQAEVPRVSGHEYLFFMDANNVVDGVLEP